MERRPRTSSTLSALRRERERDRVVYSSIQNHLAKAQKLYVKVEGFILEIGGIQENASDSTTSCVRTSHE
jgi:hypothetical protein